MIWFSYTFDIRLYSPDGNIFIPIHIVNQTGLVRAVIQSRLFLTDWLSDAPSTESLKKTTATGAGNFTT